MRIGIDIDDVLYPWYDTAHQLCVEAGITNGVTPCTWAPYEDYGCTDQEWYRVLSAGAQTGALYDAEPISGTVEQLCRLRDAGHTVHLVTARGSLRHGPRIQMLTIQWLHQHGVPHDSLTFAKDKRAVITDVFLDDAHHNYDQLDGYTEVWLLDVQHNGAHREGRRRVGSVKEFVDMVLERAS
jgi:hypothetical protein